MMISDSPSKTRSPLWITSFDDTNSHVIKIRNEIRELLAWYGYDRFALLIGDKNGGEVLFGSEPRSRSEQPDLYASLHLPVILHRIFAGEAHLDWSGPEGRRDLGEWAQSSGAWIAIPAPGERIYAFLVSSDKSEVTAQLSMAELARLAIYCQIRIGLLSVFQQYSALQPREQLTKRQIECLKWAAIGKSDWEIGQLLGLSSHTVHRHIEGAKRRLRVTTRVQAILAAAGFDTTDGPWSLDATPQLKQHGPARTFCTYSDPAVIKLLAP